MRESEHEEEEGEQGKSAEFQGELRDPEPCRD